jgi:hypothetical protein
VNGLTLIDFDDPDNEKELIQSIITNLEAQNGGRRKYKTISNKQRRKKSIKYRKKQKTNRR